jgi:uncharacterized protein YoxC
MPRQNLVVQVFLASPSDVAQERDILEAVITEANRTWSKNLGLTFELVRWETNSHPSFSTDPQAAINEQVGTEYDVFIGIFWGRIGSPTPRAKSGTLEEFNRALSRYQSTQNHPKIMLYFKDAPISPSKIDTSQLAELQSFKDSISSLGGLYSVFEDVGGFESSVRAHLAAIAQSFAAEHKPQVADISTFDLTTTHASAAEAEEDDYGFLDYIEIHEARMAEMTAAMNMITQATQRIGEQIANRQQEQQVAMLGGTNMAQRFVKRTADDMTSYAETLAAQVRTFSTSREAAFDALTNALAIHSEFASQKELLPLRKNLDAMHETAMFARENMAGMREAAAKLPRITKELNKSKRQVVSQLDLLVSEIDSVASTVTNIINAIDRMLGE